MTRLVFASTAALLACGMALSLAKNDGGGGKSDPPAPAPRPDLPQFKCHKVVGAAKIVDINRGGDGDIDALSIVLPGEDDHLFAVPKGWHPEAETGGYLVQYEDGYISYSPAAVFEVGYAPLDDIEPSSAPAFDIESLSDLLAERLFVKIEALATRDPPAQIAPGSDVPDGSPRNKVLLHLDRIEELLNEDFRTGGDAVIATHVAFGALKRQAMHLSEPAKPT